VRLDLGNHVHSDVKVSEMPSSRGIRMCTVEGPSHDRPEPVGTAGGGRPVHKAPPAN